VVLVHGFTQTMASWRPVADALAVDHRVVRVDAPGHGGSSTVRADLATSARLVGDAGGRAVYVGYSMGGRTVLRLALDRPDLVAGLVLIGATAGIDDPDERAARRTADEARARHLLQVGVPAFLTEWLAQPLFEGLPDDPDERRARATNREAGLAASLRDAGTGTMDPPWWDELHRIAAPTVVMAGERDTRFTALAHRLAAAIPHGEVVVVAGAGHAAHLQDPGAVVAVVRRLTASGDAASPG
jgi:2-succinyl-6-hydroxy-2,4-cyclohexadiene-1-carboxylate synthase